MYINLEAEIWMFYIEFIFSYTMFRAKCTLQREYNIYISLYNRDCDNSVVQFQYGEDSLDVCKSQYIKPSKLKVQ